jgi:hypothetical protein
LLSPYFLVEIALIDHDLADGHDERLAIDSRTNINEDLRSMSFFCVFAIQSDYCLLLSFDLPYPCFSRAEVERKCKDMLFIVVPLPLLFNHAFLHTKPQQEIHRPFTRTQQFPNTNRPSFRLQLGHFSLTKRYQYEYNTKTPTATKSRRHTCPA